jgi:hypothetical protein
MVNRRQEVKCLKACGSMRRNYRLPAPQRLKIGQRANAAAALNRIGNALKCATCLN